MEMHFGVFGVLNIENQEYEVLGVRIHEDWVHKPCFGQINLANWKAKMKGQERPEPLVNVGI